MKTVTTESGSVYELSDVNKDGYVLVSRKNQHGAIEVLGDDVFPMRAMVSGYDADIRMSLSDITEGHALQILPQWRHEMNVALGPVYVGIITSPVVKVVDD